MEKLFNFVFITTNLINGKQYVGDHSTNSMECSRTKNYLGSGRPYFKNAKKFYGKENFKRKDLDFFTTRQEAFDAQEKYIKEYDTLVPNGYNISPKGGCKCSGSMSSETKKKIGEANKISLKGKKQPKELVEKRASKIRGRISPLKGKKQSDESVKNRAKSNTGKKRTPEQKERMKAAQQNRKPLTEEQRKNKGNAMRGKKHSKETKKKQSESLKGKIPWNKGKHHSKESIQKMRKPHKKFSKETKLKMSLASGGKPKSEEHRKKCGLAHLGKKHTKIYCIHCQKEYADYMYKLYHGDNCKLKKNI